MKNVYFNLSVLIVAWLLSSSSALAEAEDDPVRQLAFLLESGFASSDSQAQDKRTLTSVRLNLSGEAKPEGVWLYSQVNQGQDQVIVEQSFIRLLPLKGGAVVQKTYRPTQPDKWRDAWNDAERLASFGVTEFEPSFDNGCDQYWRAQNQHDWRGNVDPESCVIETEQGKQHFSKLSQLDLKQLRETHSRAANVADIKDAALTSSINLQRVHSSSASLLAYSSPQDWRTPKAEDLMLIELDEGRVLFELAPTFAPLHVKNIRQLVKQEYFDGSHVIRSQDNYVAQWGDAQAGTPQQRSLGKAKQNLPLEFFRDNAEVGFTQIISRDAYAEQTGFAAGMPVSSDGKVAWMTHCYGMLGVGRGGAPDSGNGSSLYMVNGHAPRHLDRNVTLVGRALTGMAALSSLPRGTGPLGFYQSEDQYVPIRKVSMGTQLTDDELNIEVFRTDTDTFDRYVALRTTRNEDWFLHPTGKIEVCNVTVPTRKKTS